ncbi:MAG TPA: right-handed parallel beta-helix repeat-containing protein [Chitinophagaceae bacterium]|nr:right-handed parallel beta-helix repeat-containing protein [Chitinophagaceae bacterium]
MKKSFIYIKIFYTSLFFISFIFSNQYSLAAPLQINIKNFGAKGDGKTNDHQAFVKASKYINQAKQNITLIIPYGTYVIGQQTPDNTWLLKGIDAISLNSCNNITIMGQPKKGKNPIIIYDNNLYYGAFQQVNGNYIPQCTPAKNQMNKRISCFIGSTFNLDKCNNITIKNLELDGNQNGMIIGGFYGDKGRQLGHRGFQLINCNQVNISNMDIHHFGLDGITITSSNYINIDKIKANYNGRQGLSWVDGDNITCTNSQFNYTGRSRIFSAPGAGIDIEPEGRKNLNNGTFFNCQFIGNAGCGVLNYRNNYLGNNMTFTNCTIAGLYNWALWVQGTKFKFNNCQIYGHIAHAVSKDDAKTIDDFTTFDACYFSNVYNQYKTVSPSKYLFDWNNVKIRLLNSTVETFDVSFFWLNDLDKTQGMQSQISNTKFTSNNTQTVLSSINTGAATIQKSTFNYTKGITLSTEPGMLKGNTLNAMDNSQVNTLLKTSNYEQLTSDNFNLYQCK